MYRNDALSFWALSRHEDVLAGFKDPVTFSNAQGVSLERSSMGDASALASFLAMDPPRHDQLRALVSRGFTPRRFLGMSGSNTAHCRSLIQNSLAIGPLLSTKEHESDLPEPGQGNNWVPSLARSGGSGCDARVRGVT